MGLPHGCNRWRNGQGGERKKAGAIGTCRFGFSAPAAMLYEQFGVTAEVVAEKAKAPL